VIAGLIPGAFALAIYYLFRAYPAEHSNWQRIASAISILTGISIAGVMSGLILKIYQSMTGLKRRTVLCALVVLALGIHSFLDSDQRPTPPTAMLSGRYDFDLEWAPDETQFGGDIPPASAQAPSPPFFIALQQQLGLKLEATQGPIETLVVDTVQRPSAN